MRLKSEERKHNYEIQIKTISKQSTSPGKAFSVFSALDASTPNPLESDAFLSRPCAYPRDWMQESFLPVQAHINKSYFHGGGGKSLDRIPDHSCNLYIPPQGRHLPWGRLLLFLPL
jgi:hypothetical protein